MSQPNGKRLAQEVIERLPDTASVEDAMEQLYFLSKVERGLGQADAGQTVSHDEVKAKLGL